MSAPPPTLPPGAAWSCDFETEEGEKTWCGMEQGKEDQFDWSIHKGATPSQETGADSAFTGKYYIFIEASNPREPGDKAV